MCKKYCNIEWTAANIDSDVGIKWRIFKPQQFINKNLPFLFQLTVSDFISNVSNSFRLHFRCQYWNNQEFADFFPISYQDSGGRQAAINNYYLPEPCRAYYERLSWGGTGANLKTMMARASALQCVLDDWLRQVSLA